MLQDEDGNWFKEMVPLEQLVTNYFKNIYLDDGHVSQYGLTGAFPKIGEDDLRILERKVTREEIYNTIKCMGSFKAPRPNGFQAISFQNQWHVIGEEFYALVLKIFDDPVCIKDINSTLITLIPKKVAVTRMRDFRPISLCNVTYKTVTKIVTQRLRGFNE